MSISVKRKGQLEELKSVFRDEDDALVDPITVTLKVMDPSGNIDSYTYAAGQITRESMGVFHKDIALDESGEWRYEWVSTGTGQGAGLGQIVVESDPF